MWHACYSEHIRGRCGSILAGSYSCGRQWRWPWLGALLIVCRPTRAIKTRCQRPENLGEKLIQICTATVAALLLLLEFVLLREHPAFPVSFLRYSSSGRCAFSVGCDFLQGVEQWGRRSVEATCRGITTQAWRPSAWLKYPKQER